MSCCSKQLRSDPEFVVKAMASSSRLPGLVLISSSEDLRGNGAFILQAMKATSGLVLQFASKALKGNREVVLQAVENDPFALEFASDALKDDFKFVLQAVKQNGIALMYASKKLRGDSKIVLAATSENFQAIEYAHIPGLAETIGAVGTVDHSRLFPLVGERRSVDDVYTLIRERPEICDICGGESSSRKRHADAASLIDSSACKKTKMV